MNGSRGFWIVAVTLWLSAALQQSLARRFSFWGFEPDFLLVAMSCLSMFCNRAGAASIGFLSGAIYGAISFANMSQYVISRTVAAFLAGWANDLNLQGSGMVAAVTTAATTVGARLILLFLAPPLLITPFLGATIRSAVYNGVLAVPLYLLLKKVMGTSQR